MPTVPQLIEMISLDDPGTFLFLWDFIMVESKSKLFETGFASFTVTGRKSRRFQVRDLAVRTSVEDVTTHLLEVSFIDPDTVSDSLMKKGLVMEKSAFGEMVAFKKGCKHFFRASPGQPNAFANSHTENFAFVSDNGEVRLAVVDKATKKIEYSELDLSREFGVFSRLITLIQ